MPISVDQAMSAYGYVYELAKNVPELNAILRQAISGGWTADKLTATVESSPWWKKNADTVRTLVTQKFTDPATYAQNVANAKRLIGLKAQQLGRVVSGKALDQLVYQTLTTNASWDDQVLTSMVAAGAPIGHHADGSYVSNAAELKTHMTEVAQSYGVPYTAKGLDGWIQRVQVGADSLSGFEDVMRARAKAQYPHLANQIDAGMTVRDVADPYIQTMAQTLELDEATVGLNDPHVQRALAQVGKDGAMTSQPMWAFQRALKDDARYDKTQQAKDDAMSTLSHIGKDFGFQGGS